MDATQGCSSQREMEAAKRDSAVLKVAMSDPVILEDAELSGVVATSEEGQQWVVNATDGSQVDGRGEGYDEFASCFKTARTRGAPFCAVGASFSTGQGRSESSCLLQSFPTFFSQPGA